MRILYIANVRMPTEKAHGHQIMKMAEIFSGADIKTELIVPTRKNSLLKEKDPFDYYHIENNFKLKKIFSWDPTFLFRFPAGFYIRCQSVLFFFSLWFFLIFKNKKDCVFYTRDEYLLPFLQMFSLPIFWEAHALPSRKEKYFRFFNKLSGIVVLTGQMKGDLVKLGLDEKKIIVSPDAVDMNIFDLDIELGDAREELNLPQDKKIIGYTGSFKTKGMDKGISDVLKSLVILRSKNINPLFVAVGGSDDDIKYYQTMSDQLGVSDNVRFLGKVGQDQLAIFQKAFDILLMPFPRNKHYSYYMSPLKMFEYLAAKRPIIASDLPSIREILTDDTCLFCQPDDPDDLADKIFLLINDSSLSQKLARNSYELASDYTWESRGAKIIDFVFKFKND